LPRLGKKLAERKQLVTEGQSVVVRGDKCIRGHWSPGVYQCRSDNHRPVFYQVGLRHTGAILAMWMTILSAAGREGTVRVAIAGNGGRAAAGSRLTAGSARRVRHDIDRVGSS